MAEEIGFTGLTEDIDDGRSGRVLRSTESLCPVCLSKIDARLMDIEGIVYLERVCTEHGEFVTKVFGDTDGYIRSGAFNKPGKEPLHRLSTSDEGCPNDCGICDEHEQHTCVGVIEITSACNLGCSVCFADSGECGGGIDPSDHIPLDTVKEMIDLYVRCEGEPEVLQISGGEPTLHPDLLDILTYAIEKGIIYPMINTNGIRFAEREFAERISKVANGSMNDGPFSTPLIYLQFDGLDDDINQSMRGRRLLDLKMRALENCSELGINVVLVPTVIKGVNDHQLGEIVRFAIDDPNIKMVNFQPAARTGRFDVDADERLTIPEIIDLIDEQTEGILSKDSFTPIPCPHPTCSTASYVFKGNDGLKVLNELFDMERYIDVISNKAVPFDREVMEAVKALDSLLSMSVVPGAETTGRALCASCGITVPNIKELIDGVTGISIHAFMDRGTFDLARARKCCITQILPDGRMIPFCVHNVLYRDEVRNEEVVTE